MSTATRPEFVTDDVMEYLDRLRKSGRTNMFGAAPFLHGMFPWLTMDQANKALVYWMETFGGAR